MRYAMQGRVPSGTDEFADFVEMRNPFDASGGTFWTRNPEKQHLERMAEIDALLNRAEQLSAFMMWR